MAGLPDEIDFSEGRAKRNRKTVDYSKFAADDADGSSDDDFEGFTPPPPPVNKDKSTAKSKKDLDDKLIAGRASLDDKLLERDLKKAMNLSLSNEKSPQVSLVDIHSKQQSAVVIDDDVDDIEILGSERIKTEPPVPAKRKRKTLQDLDDNTDDEFKLDDVVEDDGDDSDFNSNATSKRSRLNKRKTAAKKKPTTAKTKPKSKTPSKPKEKSKSSPAEKKAKINDDDEDPDLKLALQLSMAECGKTEDDKSQEEVSKTALKDEQPVKPPVPVEGVVIINSIHKSPSPPPQSPVNKRRRRAATNAAEKQLQILNNENDNDENDDDGDDDMKENVKVSESSDDEFKISDESAEDEVDDDDDDDDSDFNVDEGRSSKATKKKPSARTTSKKPATTVTKQKKTSNSKSSTPRANVSKTPSTASRPGSLSSRIPAALSISSSKISTPAGKLTHMGLTKSGTSTPNSSLGGLSIRSPGLRVGLSRSQKNFKSLHPNLSKH
ncbi:uncharacterized protein LOC141912692 [Tubulanus polymorphus]|uniref:uncharacterized protein LOC141912692 n=1 Tax=Tubulanus polymorphus TaxID=672921 RepID=UPI003DA2951F